VTTKDIKIFCFGSDDTEYTYVAAANAEEAKTQMHRMFGSEDSVLDDDFKEELEFDTCEELNENQMSTCEFMDVKEDNPDEVNIIPFKEYLEKLIKEGQEFPCLFAASWMC
jgi:hypothetical protein